MEFYTHFRKSGAANIQLYEGSEVYGVVFRARQDIKKLFDKKEGHPNYYVRKLRLYEGAQILKGWIYYGSPEKLRDNELPTAEYLGIIIKGAEYWGLPNFYIENLKKTRTQG